MCGRSSTPSRTRSSRTTSLGLMEVDRSQVLRVCERHRRSFVISGKSSPQPPGVTMAKKPVRVAVTGAAARSAMPSCPHRERGDARPRPPVILHYSRSRRVAGPRRRAHGARRRRVPVLAGVVKTDDANVAFADVATRYSRTMPARQHGVRSALGQRWHIQAQAKRSPQRQEERQGTRRRNGKYQCVIAMITRRYQPQAVHP